MPDHLKPGDEIVFTVTGEVRIPLPREWYLGHRDAPFSAGVGCGEWFPILTRTIRRAGERPGYFDARFEKIEAAIAALQANGDKLARETPEQIAERIVPGNLDGPIDVVVARGRIETHPRVHDIREAIAAAIRAERERKP